MPIEPYSALYRAKLVTNNVNASVAIKLNVVARTVPADENFHLFCTAGAYLKINPMVK